MTEKRFTIADGFKIVAIRDNGEIMNSRQVCNQLNEFCEENKELKKENEQLKQSNKDAWNLIQFIYQEIKEDGYMDWGRIQDLVEF